MELLREVLDELHGVLSLRGSLLYQYTNGPPLFLHGSLVDGLQHVDTSLMQPRYDPFHRMVPRLAPRPRVVHASVDVPRDVLRESAAYRHVYREHGIDHAVCIWIDGRRPPEPGMTGMFLTRSDDDGAFEPRHLELLRNALPLLTTAAERADAPSLDAPWLDLDAGGHLVGLSPNAEMRLRATQLRPRELADRLWGPISRWQTLRTAHPFAGQARAVFHVVERRRGTLFVEVTEQDGELRLRLLDRHDVPELAELRERHGLTVSEVAVLQALALGLSNTETADYLCICEETVKTHVRRLLAKLGLQSRLQAGLLMQRIVLTMS